MILRRSAEASTAASSRAWTSSSRWRIHRAVSFPFVVVVVVLVFVVIGVWDEVAIDVCWRAPLAAGSAHGRFTIRGRNARTFTAIEQSSTLFRRTTIEHIATEANHSRSVAVQAMTSRCARRSVANSARSGRRRTGGTSQTTSASRPSPRSTSTSARWRGSSARRQRSRGSARCALRLCCSV